MNRWFDGCVEKGWYEFMRGEEKRRVGLDYYDEGEGGGAYRYRIPRKVEEVEERMTEVLVRARSGTKREGYESGCDLMSRYRWIRKILAASESEEVGTRLEWEGGPNERGRPWIIERRKGDG
uniref:Uncharacterized protein n=1 Tax=Knipowitschia caucasica TaxID=637954 RepID=A0AAV2L9J0_KNICA